MTPFPESHFTKQRRVIVDFIRSRRDHPTAADVFQGVREKLPAISLGTVYRTLDLLCQLGVIKPLQSPQGCRRFDADVAEHAHIRCAKCGRVDDVRLNERPALKIGGKTLSGYDILSYELQLTGVCPACRETSASPDDVRQDAKE